MDERLIVLNDEVQLLGYGESDSYGPWVKFRLLAPEHLNLFRGQEKGKKLGKRYGIALVEIGDDEQPVPQHVGDGMQDATEYVKKGGFIPTGEYKFDAPVTVEEAQEHLDSQKKKERTLSQEAYLMINTPNFDRYCKHLGVLTTPDRYLKDFCGIQSKSDLDTNREATDLYYSLTENFRRWVNQ